MLLLLCVTLILRRVNWAMASFPALFNVGALVFELPLNRNQGARPGAAKRLSFGISRPIEAINHTLVDVTLVDEVTETHDRG